MRVLLLGSRGLVGTAIEGACADFGFSCLSVSHEALDITNSIGLKGTIAAEQPDIVVNAVGIVGIHPCEEDPQRAFLVNTVSVHNMAIVCDKYGIDLVQLSTHSVFDGVKDGPYTEDDEPNPINVYGISKYAAEFAARRCDSHYIIRMPTLFGDRRKGNLGFPNKIFELLKEGRDIKVADDKIDSCSYSVDVARAILGIVYTGQEYGVYHVANGGSASYYDVVAEAASIIGSTSKVGRAKDGDFVCAPNALKTAMSSVKIPQIRDWQDALKEYLDGS